MLKTPQLAIGIVAALALAGGGFAAGMTFERNQPPAGATGATGAATGRAADGGRQVLGGAGGAGALGGQVPINGRVIAVNDGSITVAAVDRAQQGQQAAGASPATTSQIVLVGASTRIVKTTEVDVKLADLKVNDQVTVIGTTDSAGLVSATAIVVGGTNVLGQLFGSQTGTPGGVGQRPGASTSPRP